jgi:phosphoribosylformylglycinamidine cyclo-ligase
MSEAYRRAGVDLEAGARAVDLIKEVAASALTPEVASGVGGFAGLYRLDDDRLLVAGTDGAGTKTEIARLTGRLNTIGIDLVAMSSNDVACTGAEPLFFLDCVVVGKVVPDAVASIVSGVAEGCRRAGCALLGGETAEHPGLLEPDEFDLTGTCVGLVEEGVLLDPSRVREGDALVGIASSGLHANGFSLVRSEVLPRLDLADEPEGLGRSLGDELLEPTAIYSPLIVELANRHLIRSAAHITGGGLPENLPRGLPGDLGARIRRDAWTVPPIFDLVQMTARAGHADMFATFNMGIGMVLACEKATADEVIERAGSAGHVAFSLGDVEAGRGVRGLMPE